MRKFDVREYLPLTGRERFNSFFNSGFTDYCRRNVVGYSMLFCSVRGMLSFRVFYNGDDPPLVPECDDVAFTVRIGGGIGSTYVLELVGKEWKKLPWSVEASDLTDPTAPILTVCRVEDGKLIARFDGLSPSAALSAIRGVALQEIGSQVDVYA